MISGLHLTSSDVASVDVVEEVTSDDIITSLSSQIKPLSQTIAVIKQSLRKYQPIDQLILSWIIFTSSLYCLVSDILSTPSQCIIMISCLILSKQFSIITRDHRTVDQIQLRKLAAFSLNMTCAVGRGSYLKSIV